VCTPAAEPAVADRFDATIFWMSKRDFNKASRVTIRCATQQTTAAVERIHERIDSATLDVIERDAAVLKNLEVATVTIKTKKPIAIKPFSDVRELGRFVFVEGDDICAGGIISGKTNDR